MLGLVLVVKNASQSHATEHNLVLDRFFRSAAQVYVASRACELQNPAPVFRQYSDAMTDYLSNYYEDDIPFWVFPRDANINKHGNCHIRLNSAISQYRVARNDFNEYFPDAPVPPQLAIVNFREFKRKPGRSFNIAN